MTKRLAFVVTEDWAFWRHRRPMARAALQSGFEVHLLTRPGDRVAAIEAEGFIVHPVDMKRGSLSPQHIAGPVLDIRRTLVRIEPHIIHNVALKPVVIGTLAARSWRNVPIVNAIVGLGSVFIAATPAGRAVRFALGRALPLLNRDPRTRILVQNDGDQAVLLGLGIPPAKITLIPGSGVDCDVLTPLPEPPPAPVRIAFVGRMLKDKGLHSLMAAHRLLRARGANIELLLAGEPDLENPSSITPAQLAAWGSEPGVTALGHVENIAEVWKQAHIAVLTSRGGEGVPKSLLEAAACGRPMVATGIPGSRDICRDGETGLLVPAGDEVALAGAIGKLAAGPALRATFGAAARQLALARFSSGSIGAATVAVYHELLG